MGCSRELNQRIREAFRRIRERRAAPRPRCRRTVHWLRAKVFKQHIIALGRLKVLVILPHLPRSEKSACRGLDPHSKLPVDCFTEPMCQTRAGESGSWFGIAPNEAKALPTALAIRPPIGMIAPSPAPLTPSGLLGDR